MTLHTDRAVPFRNGQDPSFLRIAAISDGIVHSPLAGTGCAYPQFNAVEQFVTLGDLSHQGPLMSIWRRPGASTSDSLTTS
jgi:hypothetical protein